jgi:hypothetical protein
VENCFEAPVQSTTITRNGIVKQKFKESLAVNE